MTKDSFIEAFLDSFNTLNYNEGESACSRISDLINQIDYRQKLIGNNNNIETIKKYFETISGVFSIAGYRFKYDIDIMSAPKKPFNDNTYYVRTIIKLSTRLEFVTLNVEDLNYIYCMCMMMTYAPQELRFPSNYNEIFPSLRNRVSKSAKKVFYQTTRATSERY